MHFVVFFIYTLRIAGAGSNGLVKVSHTKYRPQKGEVERNRYILYDGRAGERKENRT